MRRAAPLVALAVLAPALAGAAWLAAPAAVPAPPAPLAPGAAAAAAFTQLDCPWPLPQVNPERPLEHCNARGTALTGPGNEVHLAMDPADPLHVVAVAKAYNYTRTLPGALGAGAVVPLAVYRPVITVYATTFDGGRTWHEGYLQEFDALAAAGPLEVGSSREQGSDPVVTFAPDGSVLVVALRVTSYPVANGLPVFRSTDGGISFERISDAYPLGQPDKQWVVTDHARGLLYIATSDFGAGRGGVWVTRSHDNGFTWTQPVKACGCFHPGIDVGPDGTLHVSGIGDGVVYTRSLDQGATWSAPRTIAPFEGSFPNPLNGRLYRTANIPELATSRVHPDVYVVYGNLPEDPLLHCFVADAMCHDVWLVASHDGGLTWQPRVRINDDRGIETEQVMPAIAVSPNGRDVHIAWLDQRVDPSGLLMEAYYAHSPDRGATWEPNLKLSDVPFPVALSHHQNAAIVVNNGVFLGEYIGLAASDDRAVVAFPDTRYGRADVFIATVV